MDEKGSYLERLHHMNTFGCDLIDLMDGPLSGQGIVWIVTFKLLWSTAPYPSGDQ